MRDVESLNETPKVSLRVVAEECFFFSSCVLIIFVLPQDIKVVMAMGDSITAGFGILGLDGGLDEYRGLSGPIGGDTDAVTIPNFIKYYNPTVIGASVGQHLFELPGWVSSTEKKRLTAVVDVEVPGVDVDAIVRRFVVSSSLSDTSLPNNN